MYSNIMKKIIITFTFTEVSDDQKGGLQKKKEK